MRSTLGQGSASADLDPEVFLDMPHELEAWGMDLDDPGYFSLNLAKCHVYLYRTIALELSHGEAWS